MTSTTLMNIVVCGAHLSEMPLNYQLTDRNSTLVSKTKTAASYRLYALAGGPPFRPGLVLDQTSTAAIDVEVWAMPIEQVGSFLAGIPAPLGLGSIELADGSVEKGFICESHGINDADDITVFGNWRSYIASLD